jgi:hypothetical protein
MLGEILAEIVGEAAFGRLSRSRRTQLVIRFAFGALGTVLGIVGAVHWSRRPTPITNYVMHTSVVALFAFLAAFFLFNVALHRSWRWPAIGLALSFITLFASRVLLGP